MPDTPLLTSMQGPDFDPLDFGRRKLGRYGGMGYRRWYPARSFRGPEDRS